MSLRWGEYFELSRWAKCNHGLLLISERGKQECKCHSDVMQEKPRLAIADFEHGRGPKPGNVGSL